MRTHSLVQSSPLLCEIFYNFPQLKLDMSIFMYKFKSIGRFQFISNGITFDRINYNWEDDVAFGDHNFNWKLENSFGKINIYNFHPLFVWLNSRNYESYEQLKQDNKNNKLYNVKEIDIKKHINNSYGTYTYLQALLDSNLEPIKISEIE